MTREEAIEIIKIINKRYCTLDKDERQALAVAIKTLEQESTESEALIKMKKDLKGRQKKIERLMVSCARYKYKADHYEESHSRMCKDNIILAGELAYYKQLLDFYKKDRYEWIYINEKKPDDGDWCIFTNGSKVSVERYKEDAIDHFYPEGRWFNLDDVIAWIPLPELPYKESDG